MEKETLNRMIEEFSKKYNENYCAPYNLPGIIRNTNGDTPITIDIRHGVRGIEYFTIFNGVTYRNRSTPISYLGEFVNSLPEGYSLILPHQVNITDGNEKKQITIEEEISHIIDDGPDIPGRSILDKTVKVRLFTTLNSNREYRTRFSRFYGSIVLLEEIKRISGHDDIDFQLCFFCKNYLCSDYDELCLRDLNETEFEDVKDIMLYKLERPFAYYGKLGHDMALYHYCMAYEKRTDEFFKKYWKTLTKAIWGE